MQLHVPAPEAVQRIRFEPEAQLFRELLRHSVVAQRAKRVREKNESDANRRRFLANALRVTGRIIPSIARLVRSVQEVVHFEGTEVEVYVNNDPRQNAACAPCDSRGVFLLLTSGLIERLTERELLFVIGHEFGHALYGHHQLPVQGVLGQGPGLTAAQALKLMSWSRRAEISADRVGLLCCQELDAAAVSLIKLSCGLTESRITFNIDDYVSQMEDIQALSASIQNTEDFFCSHPFSPLRVVALRYFWESKLFADLLGRTGTTSPANLDAAIGRLLGFMEPDTRPQRRNEAATCLLWGSYWVAAADGRIDELELQKIDTIAGPELATEAHDQVRRAADPVRLTRERFQNVACASSGMPLAHRHALIQKLIVVAKVNGVVTDEEKVVLREASKILGVSPGFVDGMLAMFE
jgi:Zn-dependent protease with chaperone function/uncharacterized tellurite resistance protein B-like protein